MPPKKNAEVVAASAADPVAEPMASQRPARTKRSDLPSRGASGRRAAAPAANPETVVSVAAAEPTAAEPSAETAGATTAGVPSDEFVAGGTPGGAADVGAVATTVSLEPGLSAVEISIPPMQPYTLGQVSLPMIWLSQPEVGEADRLKILTASGRDDNWLPPPGDVIVVRAPATGGQLTVTVFGPPNQPLEAAGIAVRTLGHAWITSGPNAGAPAPVVREKEVRLEALAHIERRGDQLFSGGGWIGIRGSKLRIEGFILRPLADLSPTDIEYQIIGPNESQSPWIRSPQFCGTRGRHLGITGFAIRLSPQLQARASVEYLGSYFESGVSGPFRNGEICRPLLPGDVLEAMNIRVVQRG